MFKFTVPNLSSLPIFSRDSLWALLIGCKLPILVAWASMYAYRMFLMTVCVYAVFR